VSVAQHSNVLALLVLTQSNIGYDPQIAFEQYLVLTEFNVGYNPQIAFE
jgi:hypothetical protein